MRARRSWSPALVVLLVSGLFFGCRESQPETIPLPPTPVLSVGSTWAVVTSNYLRLRERPSLEAAVLDGLTRGTVVEVLNSTERRETIENETDFWYRINLEGYKGWAFGAYLRLVESRAKAEALAADLE